MRIKVPQSSGEIYLRWGGTHEKLFKVTRGHVEVSEEHVKRFLRVVPGAAPAVTSAGSIAEAETVSEEGVLDGDRD